MRPYLRFTFRTEDSHMMELLLTWRNLNREDCFCQLRHKLKVKNIAVCRVQASLRDPRVGARPCSSCTSINLFQDMLMLYIGIMLVDVYTKIWTNRDSLNVRSQGGKKNMLAVGLCFINLFPDMPKLYIGIMLVDVYAEFWPNRDSVNVRSQGGKKNMIAVGLCFINLFQDMPKLYIGIMLVNVYAEFWPNRDSVNVRSQGGKKNMLAVGLCFITLCYAGPMILGAWCSWHRSEEGVICVAEQFWVPLKARGESMLRLILIQCFSNLTNNIK